MSETTIQLILLTGSLVSGVKSAYTAFSNLKSDIDQKQFPGLDYTPEQLFFMGFGQVSIHI
jgi:uncharacterized membrane protein